MRVPARACARILPAHRDYVASNYAALKADNPKLPILVREAAGAQAKVAARFAKGVESSVAVEGMTAKEIEGVLKSFAK